MIDHFLKSPKLKTSRVPIVDIPKMLGHTVFYSTILNNSYILICVSLLALTWRYVPHTEYHKDILTLLAVATKCFLIYLQRFASFTLAKRKEPRQQLDQSIQRSHKTLKLNGGLQHFAGFAHHADTMLL